jgi:hypothetical protein
MHPTAHALVSISSGAAVLAGSYTNLLKALEVTFSEFAIIGSESSVTLTSGLISIELVKS